jgi:arylsulfatase A-like enzyme
MDWIRVLPAAAGGAPAAAGGAQVPAGGAPASPAPLLYGQLVKDVVLAGQQRKAIVLPAPATLSYYVDVPKDAKLSLRVGALDPKQTPRALVRVTPNGGKPRELWQGSPTASWQDQLLALESFAGTVVRLDLAVEGQGAAAFSSPTIVTPQSNVAKAPAAAKNVVVLLIDTLRADRIRAYTKSSRVKTPVLDAIAGEGAVFEDSQSPENWTKPSVASVLTGLYPATHRTKQSESVLSANALMVSEVFKQAGFSTGTFLANGYVSDKFGFKQGWDAYTNYIREGKSTSAENVFRDAGNWVEKNKDKRFFLYIQTIDPHVPYDPPAEFLKMYQSQPYAGTIKPRATPDLLEKAKRVPPKVTFTDVDRAYLSDLYDAEISYHDHYLGSFIERLKKLGLYDDTILVVTSDHGEEFYDHGSYGHGHSVYQELLHVPFIVRWPGAVKPQRLATTVSTVDISPTILSASGVAVPDVMEGTDRVPQLLGALPSAPAVAFSDFLDDRRVIRAGRWKLILRGLTPTFFDLKSDPGEKVELDLKSNPIALRYCRILLGQFLGARDRGDWLSADQKGKSVELQGEAADMDEATKAGLKALGYAN